METIVKVFCSFIGLIFVIFIVTSCGNYSKSQNNTFLQEGFYPKIDLNNNFSSISFSDISEVFLKGKYFKCFGRVNGEVWQVKNNHANIANQLFLKKDDNNCELRLTYFEINLKSKGKYFYSNHSGSEKILDYYGNSLKLNNRNSLNKAKYYFKIKIKNENEKQNLKNIEIIISNIEENITNKSFYSSVYSINLLTNIPNNINQFYSDTIELKNNGTAPVMIENFQNEFIFDENCLNRILQVNETCKAKLFLPHTSISNRNFSFAVDFKYPHAEAETKEFNKDFKLSLEYNLNNVSKSEFFNDLSIFRIFKHENLIFVAVNSENEESLYVSKEGVNGIFRAVIGIPRGIEIRDLIVHKDKIYVIAFKDSQERKKGGLYEADLNNSSLIFRKIEKQLNINNSLVRVDDFVGLASNDSKVYLATKQNGIFTIKRDNNNIDFLERIPVKINGSNHLIFQDIFVDKNNIFAVRGKNIYYSKDSGQNFILIATDIPIVGRNIPQNEIKSLYTYAGSVVLGTNSGLFFSKSTAIEDDYEKALLDGFVEDISFKNNDIYDMKLFDDSLYIAAMCFVDNYKKENRINCTKENGIYTKKFSLNSEVTPLFKKDPTGASSFLGVLVTQDDIIAATNKGFQYLNTFYPKKFEMNSVLKVFKAKDEIYVLKSGQEKGLFVAKNFGKDEFKKRPISIFAENNNEISFDENNVIALTEVNNNICLLIRSNVISRGLYCSKIGEKLNFYLQNKFSNYSMVGLENVNRKLFIYGDENIFIGTFNPDNSLSLGVINYLNQLDRKIPSTEKIKSIKNLGNKIFLLTDKSLYYADEIQDIQKNGINFSIKFKKISLNIPVNINLKNIYYYNNYVLFSTDNGLYASAKNFNGLFKKINFFRDNTIDNLEGFFQFSYLTQNGELFLSSLNEDLNFNRFIKNNKKLIKLIEGNDTYYILSDNEIRKKKCLSLSNSDLLHVFNSSDQNKFIDGIFYEGNMYFLSSNYIYRENLSNSQLEKISYNNYSLEKFFIFDNELYGKSRSSIFKFVNGNFVKNYDFSFEIFSENLNKVYFTINNEVYFTKDLIKFNNLSLNLNGLKISALDFTEKKLFIGTNRGLHIHNFSNKKIITKLSEYSIKSTKIVGNSLFVVTTQKVFVSKDFGNSFTEIAIKLDETSNTELENIDFLLKTENLNLSGFITSSNGYYIAN